MTRSVICFAFAAFAWAGPTMGTPVAAPSAPSASVAILRPLTLVKLKDMDFGRLSVAGAGTATINPISGALAVTGGVLPLGGEVQAARFAGSTFSSAVVNIRVPNKTVTLTRIGGTETITLDNFTLDGQSKRTLASAGVFEFAVGATLRPGAAQVEGTYSGTFDVTIQYP